MTVAELIKWLQSCPPDAVVHMFGCPNFHLNGKVYDSEVRDVICLPTMKDQRNIVELDNAPPAEVIQAVAEFWKAHAASKRHPSDDSQTDRDKDQNS